MNSKVPALIVLGVMSFVCFFFATASTFVFSAALQIYGDAGEEATTTMLVMLGLIALIPSATVFGVVSGWRQMISGAYNRAMLFGFSPLVAIAADVVVLKVGGYW